MIPLTVIADTVAEAPEPLAVLKVMLGAEVYPEPPELVRLTPVTVTPFTEATAPVGLKFTLGTAVYPLPCVVTATPVTVIVATVAAAVPELKVMLGAEV